MKSTYQKYRTQSVESMSQSELLLTLYEEMIKDLKRCEIALDDKDYEMLDTNIDYLTRIARYLTETLDMSYDVSRDLRRLYQFITYDLSKLKSGRERCRAEIPALIEIVQNLYDGFEGASKKAPSDHIVENQGLSV